MTLTAPENEKTAKAGAATVEFRGLRRQFGSSVALDGLDLTVRPGELLALLGPSGCGKTTALRMLAGFEHPDSGEVLVDGVDVTGVPAHRRDAGMVFQSYSLFPHLSALDNVAFGLRMRKVGTAQRRARAAELLDLVGLADKGERFRTSSPAVSSSASRWPVRSHCARGCCCSTSRCRRWTPRCAPPARGDPPTAAGTGHHHPVRYARPGRGPVDGRPGRRDAGRPGRAVLLAHGALLPPGDAPSSPSSSER